MSEDRQESATAVLADFAARLCYEDLPPDVVAHAKRCILDASAAASSV